MADFRSITADKIKQKSINDLHTLHDCIQRTILGKKGEAVLERDWDNLIILDACRYDIFEHESDIEGELSQVLSRGSHTLPFLKNNFSGSYHGDIVYVSATPQFEHCEMGEFFFRDIQLWKSEWDSKMRTVLPQDVTRAALAAESRNPHKRLIVHFIQPHYPFIGETGQDIAHRTILGDGRIEDNRDDVWSMLRRGEVSKDKIWQAYRENLKIVLPHVEELVESLRGKSVVTSDHGNVFGEWLVYGHPAYTYLSNLVQVPWLEIHADERKSITFEQQEENGSSKSMDESIQSRLSDLGYLEE